MSQLFKHEEAAKFSEEYKENLCSQKRTKLAVALGTDTATIEVSCKKPGNCRAHHGKCYVIECTDAINQAINL
ncbi:MAG: hypothetical protein LBG88_02975 [Christensenellaceae bacterium]|nr:hypothetical protein [Christensenellaceae bacterium]